MKKILFDNILKSVQTIKDNIDIIDNNTSNGPKKPINIKELIHFRKIYEIKKERWFNLSNPQIPG